MEKNNILIRDFESISESPVNFEKLRNMNFLITGATGLIGSLLVKALLYLNDTKNLNAGIFAVVRDIQKAESIFLSDSERIRFVKADFLKGLPDISGNIDFIIHTASITNSKMMVTYPVETLETAVNGTNCILKLAREKNSRGVVYISSMEVYGQVNSESMTAESDLGYVDLSSVRSSYPEGKRICECMCKAYASEFAVPVKIARLAQTFGAGVQKSENRVFAQFAKSVMNHQDIVLHTKGESEGNYVYTADALIAILMLLTEGSDGEAYNISNEQSHMTIAQMADMVISEFSDGKSKLIFDIPEDSLKYGYAPPVKMHLSSAKMQSLGWKPEVSLTESYRRMMSYWDSLN